MSIHKLSVMLLAVSFVSSGQGALKDIALEPNGSDGGHQRLREKGIER